MAKTAKKEEIIEGNKIIAEFMGISPEKNGFGEYTWSDAPWFFTICKTKEEAVEGVLGYVKYYTSWDWLMPVVKKCLTVGDNSDMWDILFNALSMVEIDSLFGAVVDFIKWYNENKE